MTRPVSLPASRFPSPTLGSLGQSVQINRIHVPDAPYYSDTLLALASTYRPKAHALTAFPLVHSPAILTPQFMARLNAGRPVNLFAAHTDCHCVRTARHNVRTKGLIAGHMADEFRTVQSRIVKTKNPIPPAFEANSSAPDLGMTRKVDDTATVAAHNQMVHRTTSKINCDRDYQADAMRGLAEEFGPSATLGPKTTRLRGDPVWAA